MRIYDGDGAAYDYCRRCAPDEAQALEMHGGTSLFRPNRSDYVYDAEHPEYEDDPRVIYRCYACGRRLANMDR
jgi:hypothetical protein